MFSRRHRKIALGSALVAVALAVSACGGSTESASSSAPSSVAGATSDGSGSAAAAGAVEFNLTPEQNRVTTAKVDSLAALVPQAIRDRGTITITGAVGSAPPLGFYATDDTTIIGSEV